MRHHDAGASHAGVRGREGRLRAVRGADQLLDLRRHLGIEARGRLVVQDDHRIHDDGAGHGHALGHAARELLAVAVHDELGIEPDVDERLAGKLEDRLVLHSLHLAGKDGQVLEDVAADERVALEHDGPVHADLVELLLGDVADVQERRAARCVRREFVVRHQDLARVRRIVTHDQLQEHRLAAAGPPDDGQELAAADGQVDPLQDGLAVKGLLEARDGHFQGVPGRLGRGKRGFWHSGSVLGGRK